MKMYLNDFDACKITQMLIWNHIWPIGMPNYFKNQFFSRAQYATKKPAIQTKYATNNGACDKFEFNYASSTYLKRKKSIVIEHNIPPCHPNLQNKPQH